MGEGRVVAGLVAAAALVALAGCGEDEPEVGERPALPTETPALWNPCDALDPRLIERAFGATTTEQAGSETAPDCRFRPGRESGDPVVQANYLLFEGSLDDAWQQMGQPHDAQVDEPVIEHADAARIVVDDSDRAQLYVTGFVENGDLIQQVNVVDPRPYDVGRVTAGVRTVLTALSRHADQSGVEEEPTAEDSGG